MAIMCDEVLSQRGKSLVEMLWSETITLLESDSCIEAIAKK